MKNSNLSFLTNYHKKSDNKNFYESSRFIYNSAKAIKIICSSSGLITFLLLILFMIVQMGCERPTDNNQTNDGTPPAVPIGVRIFYASDGEILVEWLSNTEPDLMGYNVYRRINKSEFVFLAFTTSSYYLDDSLSYSHEYGYKISAIDIWGAESQRSNEAFAVPINRFKPQKPRFTSINARNWEGKISIYLNWDPNKESDVAGYYVYKSLFSTFIADSSSFIGFTSDIQYKDTSNIQLYTYYYYKIRAVDRGKLLSEESSVLRDQVYGVASQIFPSNDATINYFNYFRIKTIEVPANYRLMVQTNEYFGEFWSTYFSSSIVNDTISIRFNPPNLYPYVYYFWRIITYSNNNSAPNSISPLFKFKVKP